MSSHVKERTPASEIATEQERIYQDYLDHQEAGLRLLEEKRIEQEQARQEREARIERIRTAMHGVLGLSPDQTIAGVRAYNTFHRDRHGRRLEGGELVATFGVTGIGIEGTSQLTREFDETHRHGVPEPVIADIGLLAMEVPKAERIILVAA